MRHARLLPLCVNFNCTLHRETLSWKSLRHFTEKNNMPAIVVLSLILPIMYSPLFGTQDAYQRYWNRGKVFEIPRFSRSDVRAGFIGEKTMPQRPEPLSPRSRWKPFPRALLSLLSLRLAGLPSPLFRFFISLSLPPACPLLLPSGENSSACLYVVWSRATRYNATPECIVNQTHQTTRRRDKGCARWYLS